MFHRIALAALLIGFLAASANAQKDKPKPTSVLTWETIDADPAGKTTIKRASLPGGWLLLVQNGDKMSVKFLSDKHHEWGQASPSDNKPPKGSDKPKFDDITKSAGLDKMRADLEQARAAAEVEWAKALTVQKKLEEELQKLRADLEKAQKEAKEEKDHLQTQRDQAEKARIVAEFHRKQAEAAREEALVAKARAEQVAARADEEAASVKAEMKKLQKKLELTEKDAERLRRLLDSKKS